MLFFRVVSYCLIQKITVLFGKSTFPKTYSTPEGEHTGYPLGTHSHSWSVGTLAGSRSSVSGQRFEDAES